MSHSKHARPDHPILDAIACRWSPYSYDGRPVEREKLQSCLEAARWAASSYNEQPWTYLLAERDEPADFERALSCLLEANQTWARHAGAILFGVVRRTFSRNGNPNRVAEHDLGQASAAMAIQAAAVGLQVHQMAGINAAKARQAFGIPEGHDAITALAIGYPGAPANGADPQLTARDEGARNRKPIAEIVFRGGWNRPSGL